MTAEALVMNKNGVAIATDSVVTVATSDGPKSYNTINKLFRFSATEPIAIMVYGSVEFAQLPWETLILHHRNQLGERRLATVEDYANEFLDYLRRVDLTEEDQSSMFLEMLHGHFSMLADRLRSTLDQRIVDGVTSSHDIADVVEDVLDHVEDELMSLVDLPELRGIMLTEVVRRYRREIYRARQIAIIHPLPISVSRRSLKRFWRLAHLFLIKAAFSPGASGVIIAGFGEAQLLPSVRAYLIDGIFMNVMKYQITNRRDITKQNQAIVLPFAQTEMVYRFMQGVDQEYQAYLIELFSEFLGKVTEYIVDTHVPVEQRRCAEADLKGILAEKLDLLETMTRDHRQAHFTRPIIDAVKSLPKHDLATLAEALVQLTSLRRKMSTDSQTVGEPIDVAIIAKSDGFIWVKKKTYFDFQFNLQNRSLLS
ncbi:MAG: hypothetical protein ACR2Q4_10095 [Geminicoccaceae bacterium]